MYQIWLKILQIAVVLSEYNALRTRNWNKDRNSKASPQGRGFTKWKTAQTAAQCRCWNNRMLLSTGSGLFNVDGLVCLLLMCQKLPYLRAKLLTNVPVDHPRALSVLLLKFHLLVSLLLLCWFSCFRVETAAALLIRCEVVWGQLVKLQGYTAPCGSSKVLHCKGCLSKLLPIYCKQTFIVLYYCFGAAKLDGSPSCYKRKWTNIYEKPIYLYTKRQEFNVNVKQQNIKTTHSSVKDNRIIHFLVIAFVHAYPRF